MKRQVDFHVAANFRKFATQIDPLVIEQVRAIAAKEGKLLQQIVDEALRDYVERKKYGLPRANVLTAFGESLAEYDTLYRDLESLNNDAA